jgi:hypothetical protein
VSTHGEDYLSRIPIQSHRALARIRAFHLHATQEVLRRLAHNDKRSSSDDAISFECR